MSTAVLLTGASTFNQNLYYTTRFLAGDPFLYFESADTSTLVVSAMEVGRARKESRVKDVRAFHDFGFREFYRQYRDAGRALAQVAARVLLDHETREVRVEPSLPVQFADALRAEGITLEIDGTMGVEARRRKATDEVSAIEAAQQSTEAAMARAIALIGASEEHAGVLHYKGVPLTSERIRTEIELDLLQQNLVCEVDSTVAGGVTAADPHARGHGPLRWGEAIVMDVFPRSRASRYFADLTRTVVKGTPTDALRRMYETVREAHDAALECVGPGANGADIHRTVLDVFRRAGFDGRPDRPSMPHGTGHGIGLDIHEAPRLGDIDVELLEGEVLTIEPGLYHPDIGGVRVEDVVVVTSEGFRNLTTLSKRFELGT